MVSTLVLLAVIGGVSVLAQDAPVSWSAYLYHNQSRELIRVWRDGTQATYSLGLNDQMILSANDLTFSADGRRVAFCAMRLPYGGIPGTLAALHIRDIEARWDVLDLDMGSVVACRTGSDALSADGALLAVSTVHYFSGNPVSSSNRPIWRLRLLDTTTGRTAYQISAQSPAVIEAGIMNDGPILPYVRYLDAQQVIFAEVPYGVGGAAEWRVFRWWLKTGAIELVEHWGNISLNTLTATGEQIWVTQDSGYPAANPGGPIPANNVVKLVDRSGAERIIYVNPNWVVLDAKFVNGGQQIAIGLLSPFDEQNPTQQVIEWVLLSRTGQVTELTRANRMMSGSLVTAPDGAALLDFTPASAGNSVARWEFNYYAHGVVTTLWSFESQLTAPQIELAWGADVASAGDLQPFPAVGA
jgi:hypothetical protein